MIVSRIQDGRGGRRVGLIIAIGAVLFCLIAFIGYYWRAGERVVPEPFRVTVSKKGLLVVRLSACETAHLAGIRVSVGHNEYSADARRGRISVPLQIGIRKKLPALLLVHVDTLADERFATGERTIAVDYIVDSLPYASKGDSYVASLGACS